MIQPDQSLLLLYNAREGFMEDMELPTTMIFEAPYLAQGYIRSPLLLDEVSG